MAEPPSASAADPRARIWDDDLLGRQAEAHTISDYIASAATRVRSEKDNFSSLAIDAGYGEGKTFFLERLKAHLAANHPVAYIDAWADDFVDEPLTALAATIEDALAELFPKSSETRDRWADAKAKAAKIAAITTKGLLKRGAGLLITTAAVEGVSSIIEGAGDDLKDALLDDAKEAADAARDSLRLPHSDLPTGAMDRRIAEFREGQAAAQELKESLRALVAAVAHSGKQLPIVIIVDELDRCRPTYAIKLLEQVKHLLDVPGLFFVFGLHSDQLARAISGIYGQTFSGSDYLKRFINRTYVLPKPSLDRLVGFLFERAGIEDGKLIFPEVRIGEKMPERWSAPRLVAEYMRGARLAPRDAHLLVDLLQTSSGLTGPIPLHGPLLLPMLIAKMENSSVRDVIKDRMGVRFGFAYHDQHGRLQTENPGTHAAELLNRLQWDVRTLQQNQSYHAEVLLDTRRNQPLGEFPLGDPSRYAELVEAIGKFSQPSAA